MTHNIPMEALNIVLTRNEPYFHPYDKKKFFNKKKIYIIDLGQIVAVSQKLSLRKTKEFINCRIMLKISTETYKTSLSFF
jgi:hypothetical protein